MRIRVLWRRRQTACWYSRRRRFRGTCTETARPWDWRPSRNDLTGDFRPLLQVRCSPECKIQSMPHRGIFKHAKDGKNAPQKGRRGFPERGQRTVISGLKIHMEHTVIPAAGTRGMFRIVADSIDDGLHEANAKRLRILRHENDMTDLLAPDFIDKFGKTSGLCQIQYSAWLASVAVSPGDQRALPGSGQVNNFSVLRPVAHGVELEGMKECDVALQEQIEEAKKDPLLQAQLVP